MHRIFRYLLGLYEDSPTLVMILTIAGGCTVILLILTGIIQNIPKGVWREVLQLFGRLIFISSTIACGLVIVIRREAPFSLGFIRGKVAMIIGVIVIAGGCYLLALDLYPMYLLVRAISRYFCIGW